MHTIMRTLRRLLPGALLAAGCALAATNSVLYPTLDGSHYTRPVVRYGGQNWQLPDFSYAGYQLGLRTPGSGIPCRIERITATGGDIGGAVQAAIDRLGAAGGGTLLIPPGSFTIGRSIAVPYSHVSIVGAGSGRTMISVPASYRPADDITEGLFTLGVGIGDSGRQWIDGGEVLGRVRQTIAENGSSATLFDAGRVAVGDWVVLQQYYWPALVRRSDSSGSWASTASAGFPPADAPDATWSFAYLRRVISKSGNTLGFDAPIPRTLNPLQNPIGLRSASRRADGRSIALRENLGLVGVSIRFADNANGDGRFPAGTGVMVSGARDVWVHDVQVLNFPRHGFVARTAARVTISESAAIRAQNTAGEGRGYGFLVVSSQNILSRRNYAELARHGYIHAYGLTSVVVHSQSESAGARVNGDDSHFGLAQQLLWDNHRLGHGTALTLGYRGAASSNAEETLHSGVIWNPVDNGQRGTNNGGLISVNPAADGYGIIVGGPRDYPVFDDSVETASGARLIAHPGLQLGPPPERQAPGSRDQNLLAEALYQTDLSPSSLWDAQLRARRDGSIPAAFTPGGCYDAGTTIRGSIARSTWTGADTLVFNGDQLGWSTAFANGCPGSMEAGGLSTVAATCKINASNLNRTSGGRYSMALLPTAETGATIARISGPTTPSSRHGTLILSVHPGNAAFTMSLSLVQRGYGDEPSPSLGSVVIGGLRAGQWNTVSIPLSRFKAGSFNTVQLRSEGRGSAWPVYLDDILLR